MIKNNGKAIFISPFVFCIQEKSIHHQGSSDSKRREYVIDDSQKNKYQIKVNINGIITKPNIKSKNNIILWFFNSKKSHILKFNNDGIIRNIPAIKHKIVLNSNHQVR